MVRSPWTLTSPLKRPAMRTWPEPSILPSMVRPDAISDCSSSASPYISNCGYDGAKAALTHFYGALNPRNDAPATGKGSERATR